MVRLRLASLAALASFAAVPSLAAAQPAMPPGMPMGPGGMPDPSAMSGIPRPDPSVPPGKIVARVIRGDFAHPMTGQRVELRGPGAPQQATVGDDGRATFDGLTVGETYTVSASMGGQSPTSQPITLPAEAGVKVMLVFKPDAAAELGALDGVARADKTLPKGTVVLRAVDENDQPLAGAAVTITHGEKGAAGGDPKVEQAALTTDAHGEARWQAGAGDTALLVSVKLEPRSASSKPFSLDAESGMRIGLRAIAIGHDASALGLSGGSHLIVEVKDEGVGVVENLVVDNHGGMPFDPPGGALSLPLPDGAENAKAEGEAVAGFTVQGGSATLKGPIPAGRLSLAISFQLPTVDGKATLSQKMPLGFEHPVIIVSDVKGMAIRSDGADVSMPRQFGGRDWVRVQMPPVAPGGRMQMSLVGLPHRDPWARYGAVALAILVALWGLSAGWRGRAGGDRERLLAEKKQLLDELAALERKSAGTQKAEAKHERRHEELLERVERVMRDLDDYE